VTLGPVGVFGATRSVRPDPVVVRRNMSILARFAMHRRMTIPVVNGLLGAAVKGERPQGAAAYVRTWPYRPSG
jgi:hypothetical protein